MRRKILIPWFAAGGADVTAPSVTDFAATSPSGLTIAITTFTADADAAGFLITESSTPPEADAVGWTGSAPTEYAVTTYGATTLYPWVKDAAGNVSSAYGSPVSVSVPAFWDTFTDTDATAISDHTPNNDALALGWTNQDSFVITSNKAQSTSVSANDRLAYFDAGAYNVDVSVDVTLGAFHTGLAVRMQDATHYFRITIEVSTQKVYCYHRNAGAYTDLGAVDYACSAGQTHTLRVVVSGNDFDVYAGGNLVKEFTNTGYNTETKHGIVSNTTNTNARWENLVVLNTSPVIGAGERFTKYGSNPLTLTGDTGGYGSTHPNILYFASAEDGYNYWMFYEKGVDVGDGSLTQVYLERSVDGVTFVDTGITNPIVDEAYGTHDPCVVKVGSNWYLFTTNETTKSIIRFTSADGKTWGSPATMIAPGASGAWDDAYLVSPAVLYEGGTWYMWYAGAQAANAGKIGLATSPDGTTWTKHASNPLFQPVAATWESQMIWHISVGKQGSTYWMYYSANTLFANANMKFGLATSTDRLTWTRSIYNPVMTKSGSGWETTGLYKPEILRDANGALVLIGGKIVVYYSATNSDAHQIGKATSTFA